MPFHPQDMFTTQNSAATATATSTAATHCNYHYKSIAKRNDIGSLLLRMLAVVAGTTPSATQRYCLCCFTP
ncbi:hypothetical protein ABTH88_20060, partial [Acinetobacter baumannii]